MHPLPYNIRFDILLIVPIERRPVQYPMPEGQGFQEFRSVVRTFIASEKRIPSVTVRNTNHDQLLPEFTQDDLCRINQLVTVIRATICYVPADRIGLPVE